VPVDVELGHDVLEPDPSGARRLEGRRRTRFVIEEPRSWSEKRDAHAVAGDRA
jgi:hypothetical protein